MTVLASGDPLALLNDKGRGTRTVALFASIARSNEGIFLFVAGRTRLT
jgi:hypothetical protein